MDNTKLTYANADELVKKGIVRQNRVNGTDLLQVVIYKCYLGTERFAIIHTMKRNHEKKSLELVSPEIVHVYTDSKGKELYGKVTRGETKKIVVMVKKMEETKSLRTKI